MADLLIPLYGNDGGCRWSVPSPHPDFVVRRALSHERQPVLDWVERTFTRGWADETAVALGVQPAACFLAVAEARIAGFCCFDATFKGFLGPLGVEEDWQRRGVGAALVHAVLNAMWHIGYAYAIVGASGNTVFYERVAGACAIQGSDPGPYPPRLQDDSG